MECFTCWILLLVACLAVAYLGWQRIHLHIHQRRWHEQFQHLTQQQESLTYFSDSYQECQGQSHHRLRSLFVEMRALTHLLRQSCDRKDTQVIYAYLDLLERSLTASQQELDLLQQESSLLIQNFTPPHQVECFDLCQYMQRQLVYIKQHASQYALDVSLHQRPASQQPLMVLADRYFLNKVMHHLMGHMFRSSPAGSSLEILLEDLHKERLVRIQLSVADLPLSSQPTLPFDSDNANHLFAAHHYLAALSGQVFYNYNEAQQLCFSFHLPKSSAFVG